MGGKSEQIDSIVQIVTPENIAFDYAVAGPFRRLAAFAIDLLVRAAALMVVGFIVVVSLPIMGGFSAAGGLIAWFLLDWFYGSLFEAYMNGQTPGKRVMSLRVVTTEGQPINGLQAVLRNIMRYVDMMPPLSLQVFGAFVTTSIPPVYLFPTGMLGLIVMMLNDRFQRLGDIVCGTMVIQEERHWLTGMAKLEDARTVKLAEFIPPDFQVSRSMAHTLSTYVERRRFFSQPRRRDIAAHVAKPLLDRFGFPPDTSYDLLLCALYYRTFIASHGESLSSTNTSQPSASAGAVSHDNPFLGAHQESRT